MLKQAAITSLCRDDADGASAFRNYLSAMHGKASVELKQQCHLLKCEPVQA